MITLINSVNEVGRVTRDVELRTTANGNSILSFSIAVNDRVQENGEWKDRANYFNCKMFGKRAEGVSKILTKGAKVAIQGSLRQSKWTDKQGVSRESVDIIVNEIEVERPAERAERGSYQAPAVDSVQSVYDEDIPF